MLVDSYGRQIRDLRVSLTDRCNFRCFYCLPNGEPPMARKENILSYEELAEICEIFVALGIEKIRLTGGEPLLRKDIEVLIEKLARLKVQSSKSKVQTTSLRQESFETQENLESLKSTDNGQRTNDDKQHPKLKDLALTTNGFSLSERAEKLKKCGLDRVTISLDSLKKENFKRITGVDKSEEVFAAIAAAKSADLTPIRLNAVVVRGWNDDEIVDLARFARKEAVSMRFIEYMPLDSAHEWNRDLVVAGKEIYEKINEVFPLELKETSRGSETAWKYRFQDGAAGEIGIIAPVTEMFCSACSRIRLTADGQIRTCLFSIREHNLRDILRSGAKRSEIVEFIKSAVMKKEPRHFINDAEFAPASRSMSFIGG